MIAVTGVLVDRAVTDPGVGAVAVPLAVPAGLFTAQQILGPLLGVVRYRATSRIDGAVAAEAMEAAARPAGVGLVENLEPPWGHGDRARDPRDLLRTRTSNRVARSAPTGMDHRARPRPQCRSRAGCDQGRALAEQLAER